MRKLLHFLAKNLKGVYNALFRDPPEIPGRNPALGQSKRADSQELIASQSDSTQLSSQGGPQHSEEAPSAYQKEVVKKLPGSWKPGKCSNCARKDLLVRKFMSVKLCLDCAANYVKSRTTVESAARIETARKLR